MSAQAIYAVARADFLERVRRYSFLVTLLFTVFLGYAAATGKIVVSLDDFRGVYTAGWIGLIVSMVTTTFVSLIGFYIVKNSIDRDRCTRVGQILASTPLGKTAYLLGKFGSNFAVLTTIVLILACGAVAMFFLVAEDRNFHAWALLSPFLFIALPTMALVAGLALLFESVPLLRGGLGNVLWFFVWSFSLALPEIFKHRWLDPMGFISTMDSVLPAARAAIPNFKNNIGLNFSAVQAPIAHNLRFEGIPWTGHSILVRLLWVGVAIVFALIAAIIFDRFDDARAILPGFGTRGNARANSLVVNGSSGTAKISASVQHGAAVHLTPLDRTATGHNFLRIFSAELRLALQGLRWWGYAVAAGLLIAQFVAPFDAARGPLLAVAWLWPALVWSAMGSRESRFGVRQLIFSCANILPRQLFACWLAGVFVALLTGAGAGFRLVVAGQYSGFFAFLAATLFIPSLALALGVLTGSGKFFEALYSVLWYIGPINHAPGIDFTGSSNGARTVQDAIIYLVIAAILLATSFIVRTRQLRGN
jgi:hypothetical protein